MSVRVKLPNGKISRANLGKVTREGFRTASVQITDDDGSHLRVAGRVTARHGFKDGRVLPFEVKINSENSASFLRGIDLYFNSF